MPKPLATWNTARDAWERPQTEGLFCEHLDVFSETFPTSGMTANGAAYELPTWEPLMAGSGYSSLQPSALLMTPVASEGLKPSNTMGVARRLTTGQVFLTNQIVSLCGLDPSEKLLPTPTVGNATGGNASRSGARGEELLLPGVAKSLAPMSLPDDGPPMKLLRTPCAAEAEGGPRNPARPGSTMRLSDQVREETQRGKLLPSPRASEGEKGGPNMRGSKGDLMLSSAVTQLGASTSQPSDAGKQLWEDVPLPLPNPPGATEATGSAPASPNG